MKSLIVLYLAHIAINIWRMCLSGNPLQFASGVRLLRYLDTDVVAGISFDTDQDQTRRHFCSS